MTIKDKIKKYLRKEPEISYAEFFDRHPKLSRTSSSYYSRIRTEVMEEHSSFLKEDCPNDCTNCEATQPSPDFKMPTEFAQALGTIESAMGTLKLAKVTKITITAEEVKIEAVHTHVLSLKETRV